MAKFSLSNTMAGTPQAIAAAYKTLWDITAATGATTLRRAFIYHVQFGAADAPAASDGPIVWKIDRQTTLGTRTAATPAPLDPVDAAALITAGVNTTAEPTVTTATQLLEMPLNQRSTYQWIAKDGGELIVPATNTTGLGGRGKSAVYTGTANAGVHFFE